MLFLRNLIFEVSSDDNLHHDFRHIQEKDQEEFHLGQDYQSWKLVPAQLLKLTWLTFAKYGRVNERALDKIWELLKTSVIKVILNSEIKDGVAAPSFFYKDDYDEITEEEWDRWFKYVSDRSGSRMIRNSGEVEGNARYSDRSSGLFKLLEKAYKAETPEEKLLAMDQIFNFVHGLGDMAKWFVEGGWKSLEDLSNAPVKGINLQGKLTEASYGKEMVLNVWGEPCKGVLSKNTIPDERPYRISWFSDADTPDVEAMGHVDLDKNEVEYVLAQKDFPRNVLYRLRTNPTALSIARINESTSVAGKTFIVVDVQPEYKNAMPSSMVRELIQFIHENYEQIGHLVFLYNGADTLGMIDETSYKMWWIENGLDENIVDRADFYDKGYAFFRYCMDSGTSEEATTNFIRFMYENDIRDSRKMNREMWAKYLREYRRTDRKEVMDLLRHASDCVHIPDLMDYLKRYTNLAICGGGVNECLKEVEIALQALRKPYDVISQFTY